MCANFESNEEPENIPEFVRRGIQTGLSRESTFDRTVRQFYNIHTSEVVKDWFKQLDIDQNSLYTFPERHRRLLKLIFDEYAKAERAIQAQSCPSTYNCNLRLLNSRYAVDILEVDRKFRGLVVFDLLYGARKEFEVKDLLLFNSSRLKLEVIDPEHILLIKCYTESFTDRQVIRIHLVKLNLDGGWSRVLDSRVLEGFYLSVMSDFNDRSCFFLSMIHREQDGCWALRLNAGRLEFLPRLLNTSFMLDHQKLRIEGDHMYGFKCQQFDNGQELVYYESTMIGPELSNFNQLQFMKQDEDVRFSDLKRSKYFWFKNVCYILQWFEKIGTSIFKCDLETGRITKVATYRRVLPVKSFQIDEDEVLCVCTESEYRKQHMLHRIPLRQPDRLLILSLIAVRRHHLTFMNPHEYENMISGFPSKLRPFINSIF